MAYHTDGDHRARDRLVQLYLPLVEAFANRYRVHGADRGDLVQVGTTGLLDAIERFDPKRGDEFAALAVPTIAGEIKRHLRDRDLPGEAVDATTDGELESRLLLTGAFDVLDDTERRIVYLRFVREVSRREGAAELGMTADQLRRRTRVALGKLRAELEGSAFPNFAQESRDDAGEPEPGVTPAPAANQPRRAGERGGRILVRMPPPLHDELANAAEREGVSLNQHITTVLGSALHAEHRGAPRVPGWLPTAIVTNIVVAAVFLVGAVVLLVVAWQQGW